MNNLVLVATMVAKEGKSDFLKAELAKLLEPTHQEEACVEYKIHQDLQDPNKFVAYEIWKSAEGLQAHTKTAHMLAFNQVNKDNDVLESFAYVTLNEI